MTKTKILCSLGPKSENVTTIRELLKAGVSGFRLSATHYELDRLIQLVNLLDEVRMDSSKPFSIIVDLPGSKLRIKLPASLEFLEVRDGENVLVSEAELQTSKKYVILSESRVIQQINEGDVVLLDDGRLQLRVVKKYGKYVDCFVERGGKIKKNSGVNLPTVKLSIPSITEKDRYVIKSTSNLRIDYYCLSFVRSSKDVYELKNLLETLDSPSAVLAKIETKEALENFEEICKASDGIIIARGDLAVETSLENLPILQKMLISRASRFRIPIIVATQLLESMVENTQPTRTEVTDIANAILDGADGLLLTIETAIGERPVLVVETMKKILKSVEEHLDELGIWFEARRREQSTDTSDAIAKSSYEIARETHAKLIIASTASGSTARRVSYFRPNCPILATTPKESTYFQLPIVWGVVPVLVPEAYSVDIVLHVAVEKAKTLGYVEPSDVVIITLGTPCGVVGTTNMLKVHIVE
ncbi:pyruvate kinase [Pseudothermotoga sp.]|nr:pyruvate kinase [Pseudothermotoga sp.]MCX7812681.1 pyruvate kinase [Pseudothermotoga sp.]MDW8138961.1 pyruvate kinase [Pseudothermotoga sp.]